MIGCLDDTPPDDAQARVRLAGARGFSRLFWEINTFGTNWEHRYDRELAWFPTPPIAVFNPQLTETNFIKYFQWYDRYGSRLHSVVVNADRLCNWDLKSDVQRRDANRVMRGLCQLIKARQPTAFVWARVVNMENGSDTNWLKSLTFKPDGLLVWNLPVFWSSFEAAREKCRALTDPSLPMVVAPFYGYYPEVNSPTNRAEFGEVIEAIYPAFEREVQKAGYRGLAPEWHLFQAMAEAQERPQWPKAASPNSDPPSAAELWNYATTVEAYQKFGRRHADWDKPALEALRLYALYRSDNPRRKEPINLAIGLCVHTAIRAGCDDPLIQYLQTRYNTHEYKGDAQWAEASANAARAVSSSRYHEVRKFLACFNTAKALRSNAANATNPPPALEGLKNLSQAHLAKILADKSIPLSEVRSACASWMGATDLYKGQSKAWFDAMDKPLTEHWPNAAWALAQKGDFYLQYAWEARGHGWASTVTPEGWRLCSERLSEAETLLQKAWTLDPLLERVPVTMLSVELGQHKGRERMELWFRRAMELNPNNYNACWAKLSYLEPKWYGTPADMIAFGRECAASTQWGEQVPLVLMEVYLRLEAYLDADKKAAFWKQPEIWPDLQASFEQFFKLNPQDTGRHHDYAWLAYKCEQWDELNRQIGLLGPVNHAFFGGKDAFDKMVRLAKEHGGQKTK